MSNQERIHRLAEVYSTYQKAIIKNAAQVVLLDIDFLSLTLIVAQLELALRHPANDHTHGETVRPIIKAMHEQILAVAPELEEYLKIGNNPNDDLTPDEMEQLDQEIKERINQGVNEWLAETEQSPN